MKRPTTRRSSQKRTKAVIIDDFITLFYAAGNRLFAMRRVIAKSLDLTSPEFAALLAVARLDDGEGVRISTLADDIHVASANMTATINALLRAGWVHKTPDPNDSRAIRVILSDKAKANLASLRSSISQINESWFAGASTEQLESSCAVLGTLIRNYEQTMAIATLQKIR